ncbi:hypothetical protein LL969_07715, partial [Xanthomonas campestris pv. phormiicola]|nr:hypothetical protein [Xanthomonas campestris pv. phormiicola]
MNTPGVIDDYLEGLLHDVIAEERDAERQATLAAASAAAAPEPVRAVQAPAPVVPTPEDIAAAVLAEADADPALAGIMSQQALAPRPAG